MSMGHLAAGACMGLVSAVASGSVVENSLAMLATDVEVDASGGTLYWFDVDVSGATFYDGLGSAMNQVMEFVDDPFYNYVLVAQIRWDMGISTVGNSWLSEASIEISTTGNSHTLTPGVGMDFPGFESSVGEFDLFGSGNSFFIMDGLRLEFFESFDDVTGEADAFLTSGSTLSFGLAVPTPGSVGLLMCAGLIGARRRRL